MLKIEDEIEKLNSSELEKITLIKDSIEIFSGTILQLKHNKSLLNLYLKEDLLFMNKKGYVGYIYEKN